MAASCENLTQDSALKFSSQTSPSSWFSNFRELTVKSKTNARVVTIIHVNANFLALREKPGSSGENHRAGRSSASDMAALCLRGQRTSCLQAVVIGSSEQCFCFWLPLLFQAHLSANFYSGVRGTLQGSYLSSVLCFYVFKKVHAQAVRWIRKHKPHTSVTAAADNHFCWMRYHLHCAQQMRKNAIKYLQFRNRRKKRADVSASSQKQMCIACLIMCLLVFLNKMFQRSPTYILLHVILLLGHHGRSRFVLHEIFEAARSLQSELETQIIGFGKVR